MRLDRKTRRERVQRGVRLHCGGIDVEFFSPHQPGGLTLLHNLLKDWKCGCDRNPFTFFIIFQRNLEEWLSKGPVVLRRGQVNATTMKHVLAESFPRQQLSIARV